MPSDERSEKQAAAQQAVDILHEISTILVSVTDCPHLLIRTPQPQTRFYICK